MDFPEIGSVWQKPVNGGEIIESRRVTRFVRENYPANRPESQTAWVCYVDRRGEATRAALQDWRGWAKKATKIVDGQPTMEPELVPPGGL